MDLKVDNQDYGMEYQFWEGTDAVYCNQYKKCFLTDCPLSWIHGNINLTIGVSTKEIWTSGVTILISLVMKWLREKIKHLVLLTICEIARKYKANYGIFLLISYNTKEFLILVYES